jgi:fatty-acyl-CoA synthase
MPDRDTVAALVRSRAGDPHPGLSFEGERWSWAEVVTEMEVRARLLERVVPTDPPHVGVLLDNVPEYLFLLGGVALAGRVLVALNPTRRGEELARDIRHADCQVVVTDTEHVELLDGLDLGAAAGRVFVIDASEYGGQLALFRGEDAHGIVATPGPEDLFMLIFTSGSTGAPKAVRMTQGRAAGNSGAALGFGPDDVLYCSMPMFHGNALSSMVFPSMGTGASLVLKRRFSASAFLSDVREHGCTFTSTIGRALTYILSTPETELDRDHQLRFLLGPESSTADMKAFRRRFGVPVFGGYGSSENAIVMSPAPGQPAEALGQPSLGLDVAVIDAATNEECPRAVLDADGRLRNADEAIGELVGRNSLGRFEGYYDNDEATLERSRNGWYWSGDLAYRDEDGIFYFAGRSGDWLRVDGENFAAAPVERVLQRFSGVNGVVVFGVPDERTIDDQAMAVLEMEDGATFDAAAFDAFLLEQRDLGTKWSPRYVRVTSSLPVTGTNKVDKAPLRRDRWTPADGDAVYWRPERREELRLLTTDDVGEIRRRFESSGRVEILDR